MKRPIKWWFLWLGVPLLVTGCYCNGKGDSTDPPPEEREDVAGDPEATKDIEVLLFSAGGKEIGSEELYLYVAGEEAPLRLTENRLNDIVGLGLDPAKEVLLYRCSNWQAFRHCMFDLKNSAWTQWSEVQDAPTASNRLSPDWTELAKVREEEGKYTLYLYPRSAPAEVEERPLRALNQAVEKIATEEKLQSLWQRGWYWLDAKTLLFYFEGETQEAKLKFFLFRYLLDQDVLERALLPSNAEEVYPYDGLNNGDALLEVAIQQQGFWRYDTYLWKQGEKALTLLGKESGPTRCGATGVLFKDRREDFETLFHYDSVSRAVRSLEEAKIIRRFVCDQAGEVIAVSIGDEAEISLRNVSDGVPFAAGIGRGRPSAVGKKGEYVLFDVAAMNAQKPPMHYLWWKESGKTIALGEGENARGIMLGGQEFLFYVDRLSGQRESWLLRLDTQEKVRLDGEWIPQKVGAEENLVGDAAYVLAKGDQQELIVYLASAQKKITLATGERHGGIHLGGWSVLPAATIKTFRTFVEQKRPTFALKPLENRAPGCYGANVNVQVGEESNVDIYPNDPDYEEQSWHGRKRPLKVELASGASSSLTVLPAEEKIKIRPTAGEVGTHEVGVKVIDSKGASGSCELRYDVIKPPQPAAAGPAEEPAAQPAPPPPPPAPPPPAAPVERVETIHWPPGMIDDHDLEELGRPVIPEPR